MPCNFRRFKTANGGIYFLPPAGHGYPRKAFGFLFWLFSGAKMVLNDLAKSLLLLDG